MKIIHCADLHLGSSFSSNLSFDGAKDRKGEIVRNFERTVEKAEEDGVRVIMICGDLFDTSNPPKRTGRQVAGIIREHSGIDFLVVSGNHDRTDLLSALCIGEGEKPENLIIFPEGKWETVRYGDVAITGVSLAEDEIPPLPELDPKDKNILMLHCDIGKVGTARFACRGVDYLALGHYHSYKTEKIDERGIWCYSGCHESRGFDETGEKGYVIIDTDGDKLGYSFVLSEGRNAHRVERDVSGLASERELILKAEKAVEGIPSEDMVLLVLTGEYTVDAERDAEELERLLSERFFLARVHDESVLKIDPNDYIGDISLKGEFIRLTMGDPSLSDEEKERVVTLGVRALRGEDV